MVKTMKYKLAGLWEALRGGKTGWAGPCVGNPASVCIPTFITRTPSWEVEKTRDQPVAGEFSLIKDLMMVLTTYNTLVFSTSRRCNRHYFGVFLTISLCITE
jgi:hypothetical protein